MTDIVNDAKAQFARVLNQSDWEHLLEVAEYLFETAVKFISMGSGSRGYE